VRLTYVSIYSTLFVEFIDSTVKHKQEADKHQIRLADGTQYTMNIDDKQF